MNVMIYHATEPPRTPLGSTRVVATSGENEKRVGAVNALLCQVDVVDFRAE
jgi:hypothetical protein